MVGGPVESFNSKHKWLYCAVTNNSEYFSKLILSKWNSGIIYFEGCSKVEEEKNFTRNKKNLPI